MRLGPVPLRNVTKTQFGKEISCLDYQSLLNWTDRGIQQKDFTKLENQNSPIPQRLIEHFPGLQYFNGFSINLFRVRREGTTFRLFPVSVSRHSRDSSRFQVDMIQFTSDLVPDNTTVSNPQHVLATPFLTSLLSAFSSKAQNRSKFQFLCRSCLKLFQNRTTLTQHFDVCATQSRKSAVARRPSLNQFIHTPFRWNPFNNKRETHGLRWSAGMNFKLLRPLTVGFLDLEAYNKPIKTDDEHMPGTLFDKPPTNTTTEQSLLSYCYLWKCLYDNIKLPETLSAPRIKICKQTPDSSEKDLIVSLFTQLRNDILLHDNLLRKILTKTKDPPKRVPFQELLAFRAATSCSICGKTFGQMAYSHVSRRYYKITRTLDHCHLSSFPHTSSNIRGAYCQG